MAKGHKKSRHMEMPKNNSYVRSNRDQAAFSNSLLRNSNNAFVISLPRVVR